MIKLIATDIDGTLVKDSSPEIYPEIIEAIKELTDQGIVFVVASGRSFESIRRMFSEVEDRIGYIAENGAHIVYKGENLLVTPMDEKWATEIIDQLDAYEKPFDYVVSTPKGSVLSTKSSNSFRELMETGYHNKITIADMKEAFSKENPVIKAAVFHPGSIRKEGETVLIPAWQDKVKTCMAGEEWVDFMDSSVDKGNALNFLQQFFGISKAETMAFGDNGNDVGMMKAAGESYAVENAISEVKQAAKYICPSYDKKGVYEILKSLYKEGGEKDA